jgi:hypothetical protein
MRALLGLIGIFCISVGYADVAIIAHPDNPLTTLAPMDIKRIFLKQTKRFPDGSPVQVATLAPDQSLTRAFYQSALTMTESQWRTYWAQYSFSGQKSPPAELRDQDIMLQWVASTPDALGFIHVERVDDSVKVLRTLSIEPGSCGDKPGCD